MAERNYPLVLGLMISGLFVLLALFGSRLAPQDPMESFNRIVVDGQAFYRPFRPGQFAQFPLGTDQAGRDLLSRILWGVRPTMILCGVVVIVRMVVGVPLGLLAGWFRGATERVVDTAISVSLAVPALIFAMAVISLLDVTKGLSVFIVALSLTGWADIADLVKNRTLATAQEPYIESARSVGVPSWGILRQHILPQLWPILPSVVAFELSAVLLLVAELGFLGLYIGGGFVYYVARGDIPADWAKLTSGYPELGQLLSDIWASIILVPWQIASASVVVLLAIFGFNMLGEGWRRRMDITRLHSRRRWWDGVLRGLGKPVE